MVKIGLLKKPQKSSTQGEPKGSGAARLINDKLQTMKLVVTGTSGSLWVDVSRFKQQVKTEAELLEWSEAHEVGGGHLTLAFLTLIRLEAGAQLKILKISHI